MENVRCYTFLNNVVQYYKSKIGLIPKSRGNKVVTIFYYQWCYTYGDSVAISKYSSIIHLIKITGAVVWLYSKNFTGTIHKRIL